MISTETKEQEVLNISEKDRAASPKLTDSRATPGPMVKRFPRAWLLLPGGVLVAAAVWVLLPPSFQVTKLATMTARDEAVGVGYVQAKVPVSASASAKINGVIRKVYVDQGDPIKKGQVTGAIGERGLSQPGHAGRKPDAGRTSGSVFRTRGPSLRRGARPGGPKRHREKPGRVESCEDQLRPGEGTL